MDIHYLTDQEQYELLDAAARLKELTKIRSRRDLMLGCSRFSLTITAFSDDRPVISVEIEDPDQDDLVAKLTAHFEAEEASI